MIQRSPRSWTNSSEQGDGRHQVDDDHHVAAPEPVDDQTTQWRQQRRQAQGDEDAACHGVGTAEVLGPHTEGQQHRRVAEHRQRLPDHQQPEVPVAHQLTHRGPPAWCGRWCRQCCRRGCRRAGSRRPPCGPAANPRVGRPGPPDALHVGQPHREELVGDLLQLRGGEVAAEVRLHGSAGPLRFELVRAGEVVLVQLAVAVPHQAGECLPRRSFGRRRAGRGVPAVAERDDPPGPLPAGAALGLLHEAVLGQRPEVERARRRGLPDQRRALGRGQRPAEGQLVHELDAQRVGECAQGARVVEAAWFERHLSKVIFRKVSCQRSGTCSSLARGCHLRSAAGPSDRCHGLAVARVAAAARRATT